MVKGKWRGRECGKASPSSVRKLKNLEAVVSEAVGGPAPRKENSPRRATGNRTAAYRANLLRRKERRIGGTGSEISGIKRLGDSDLNRTGRGKPKIDGGATNNFTNHDLKKKKSWNSDTAGDWGLPKKARKGSQRRRARTALYLNSQSPERRGG